MEAPLSSPGSVVSLESIATDISPGELVRHFVPTPRFARVSFDSYAPDPNQPSQAAARERARQFVGELHARAVGPTGFFARLLQPRSSSELQGLYLDGGFGVGKTHLLAAAWYAAPAPKSYLSFAELAYCITHLGMEPFLAAFRDRRLLCVDEFELDDVANTRLAATFLRGLRAARTPPHVITTSNTLPTDLGAGRFAAGDFQREIGEIAAAFAVVHIEGEDYRHRPRRNTDALGETLSSAELRAAYRRYAPRQGAKVLASFDELATRLASLHPMRYVRLLAPIEALFLTGLEPIQDQGAALRFVHFVDKLYDQQIRLAVATTCPLADLFLPEYRDKGYAKKYQRCLSRLHELLTESASAWSETTADHGQGSR
jgi:cell division protein ZapE